MPKGTGAMDASLDIDEIPANELADLMGEMDDLSMQAAHEASKVAQLEEVTKGRGADAGEWIILPNGYRFKASDYYRDYAYLAGDHSSIFANPAKHLKAPKLDHMYVWASRKDPMTLGRVRNHSYRRVEVNELRDDTDLPVEVVKIEPTQREAGGEYVSVLDVMLMEVKPEAVRRLYKAHVAQAALRTATNLPFEELKNTVQEMTQGKAEVFYERQQHEGHA